MQIFFKNYLTKCKDCGILETRSLQNAKKEGENMREWLKKTRQNANMTMKQVAEAVGISECYYSQIENGTRNASVLVAKKIADTLGFSWQRFFEEVA